MDEITTIEQALAWLQARGYNTDYRSPEPDSEARRIDRMAYSEYWQKEVLHFEWCQTDAEVIAAARRMQAELAAAAAPDLYTACRAALRLLSEYFGETYDGSPAAKVLDMVDAAVRKAEEGQGHE